MAVASIRYKSRLLIILFALLLAIIYLIGSLFYWQVIKAEFLQRKALGQWTTSTVVAAQRGTIYDRTGKEVLAISALSKSLVAKPVLIDRSGVDPNEIADSLYLILGEGYSRDTIYKRITNTAIGEYTLARHLSDEQIQQVEALNYTGIVLVDDTKRYYPNGSTLAQVLGSTTIDGVGKDGLELKYDKYLRGLTGKILSSTDVSGNQIPGGEERYIDPTNGLNLQLTIDYVLQKIVESAMLKCLNEQKAKKVECIVMDPKTGEILAMVTMPDYDLNDPPSENLQELSRNSVVLDVYEPGSTFKIFTLAAALDSGAVTTDSHFYCAGYQMVDGQKIKCWRTVPHGDQTLTEAVCHSCNPAFMQMGLKVGKEKMYEYIRAFGFGSTTGIDFSADEEGLLIAPKYVQNVDLARISFGQTIGVTPLQLLTGACAVINGGTLYQPHLVKAMVDDDGNVVQEIKPTAVRQVISEETSATVCSILEEVVTSGSGKNAYIPGYKVGGKTGTAQKYRDGQIVRDKHIASFFGFAPADDPQIAVLVVVDEPDVSIDFGSIVAAPYVKEIIEQAMDYWQVPARDLETDNENVVENIEVPNITGMSCEQAEIKLESVGLQMLLSGAGTVVSQTPAPGVKVSKHSIIKVTGDIAVDSYIDILD